MEWMIIPGAIAGAALLYFVLWLNQPRYNGHGEFWGSCCVVALFALLVASILCPSLYYSSQNDVIKAQAYYDNVLEPNIIETGNGTVVVSGIGPAMWQAGSVVDYNGLIRTNRHWDSVPVIGTVVYRVPDDLPYAEVR